MKRQSSNNVKILKIAASATKHTRKLSASERKSVASMRFGKPRVEKPGRFALLLLDADVDPLESRDRIATEDRNGTRLTNKNNKLKARMKIVASHGPR